jgi:hypothetical protein
VRRAIRAELLKLGTTKTALGLLAAMVGLVLLSVILHSLGLRVGDLSDKSGQLRVLTLAGETTGAVFAGLLGAMSITAEIRQGTIRPTFLGIPKRGRVLAAKIAVSMTLGIVFGLLATGVAASVGTAAISARGVNLHLQAGDYSRLIAGGAGVAALWAAIGVGVGAAVRNQVAAIAGIFVWLLIIENILSDSASSVSRYLPGSLAQAVTSERSGLLHSPVLALVFLAAYAAAATVIGSRTIMHRDFA